MDKRSERIYIRVTPEEKAILVKRQELSGITNLSTWVRKIAMDGYVLQLNVPELKEMISLLRYSSNNLNQLTKRVHETGRIYDADLEDIKQGQERIWDMADTIITKLAKLK